MRLLITAVLFMGMLFAGSVLAGDDALGLYFSSTEFTLDSASTTISPGFTTSGYIVLTNPTGAVVDGYEVGISCSAADFAIPLTDLLFDTNAGTNANQIITFATPKPVVAGGTVLATIFFTTESVDMETIAFGASSPASLPGEMPVVDFGAGGLVACSLPFDAPAVAWLNGQAVPTHKSTWDAVKVIFK